MHSDINLYENARYVGFYPLSYVEECFTQYEEAAIKIAAELYDDQVVLYAIYDYYNGYQNAFSADFYLRVIPYDRYVRFANAISVTARLFFKKGRKVRNEE